MDSAASETLQRLPLHKKHVAAGAKIGAFGRWEVPVYFSSILEEHRLVRSQAGLFDISHMGELFIEGPGSESFLQRLLPRDIGKLDEGRAQYMPLLNENGGIIDDILLYRAGRHQFLMVVNAGNISRDRQWIESQCPPEVSFKDQSPGYGLLALQGPRSETVIRDLFGAEYAGLKYYRFRPYGKGLISRTGYTGEDGFEIMVPNEELMELWETILKAGEQEGVRPAGFGARDTLRLEAGMLLHGHDMDESVTPLEAGLSWAIDSAKKDFIGKEILEKQIREGIRQRLAGFEILGRGIPREGYRIEKDGRQAGRVTSGSFSPTLKKNIGLGYVELGLSEEDREIEVLIRERPVKARIVRLPFYKRKKPS